MNMRISFTANCGGLLKTISMIALCVLCGAGHLRAQHPDAGTVAFPFLTLGYEARAAAMGGAAVAIQNDIYGMLSNPSAIGYVNRKQIMAGYRQIILDMHGLPFGFVYPTSKGVFGANLITMSTDEFNIIDENQLVTKERAKSGYTAGAVSWGTLLYDNLSVGANLKIVYHNLQAGVERYSSDGFAVDLGAQYRINNGRLIYGAVLRNFGFVRSGYLNKFNDYPLPYGVEIGATYVPRHVSNLRVALDVNKTKGDYLNFEPGFEYSLSNNVFLRGGYNFSFRDLESAIDVFRGENDDGYQKSNAAAFSLGGGMAASVDGIDLKIDAALQFYSGLSRPSFIFSVITAF